MSAPAVFDLLRRVPLFRSLPEGELRTLAESVRLERKGKGAHIFEEGSAADSCYVLTSGRAKVVLSGQDGTEVVLGLVEPFELVGELSLLDRSSRSAGLVATDECQLIRISNQSFSVLRHNRAFEDELVVYVTLMLRRATAQLRAIYTYTSAERVAWSLARLAARRGRREGGKIVLTPRPHHHELADMTGCTRETVSRTLLELKRAKSVSWTATEMTIDETVFAKFLESERGIGKAAPSRLI